MVLLGQAAWEFGAGTFAGLFVGMFAYLFISTILNDLIQISVPELFSTTGFIIVLLIALRIGQWRVNYWRHLTQDDPSE